MVCIAGGVVDVRSEQSDADAIVDAFKQVPLRMGGDAKKSRILATTLKWKTVGEARGVVDHALGIRAPQSVLGLFPPFRSVRNLVPRDQFSSWLAALTFPHTFPANEERPRSFVFNKGIRYVNSDRYCCVTGNSWVLVSNLVVIFGSSVR